MTITHIEDVHYKAAMVSDLSKHAFELVEYSGNGPAALLEVLRERASDLSNDTCSSLALDCNSNQCLAVAQSTFYEFTCPIDWVDKQHCHSPHVERWDRSNGKGFSTT